MVNMKGLYGFFDFLKNLRKLILLLSVLLFCFSSYAGSITSIKDGTIIYPVCPDDCDTTMYDTGVAWANDTSYIIFASCYSSALNTILEFYDTNAIVSTNLTGTSIFKFRIEN